MTQQKSKKRSSEEMRESRKKEQQKKSAAKAAAKVAQQTTEQASDSESDSDMSDAEEDIEDVIGGNTDFYFDDGQVDDVDADERAGASAKKRSKKDGAAEKGPATEANADDDDLIVTDIDSKDVEYRVDEADEASKSTS